jgi:hypothetical protein
MSAWVGLRNGQLKNIQNDLHSLTKAIASIVALDA